MLLVKPQIFSLVWFPCLFPLVTNLIVLSFVYRPSLDFALECLEKLPELSEESLDCLGVPFPGSLDPLFPESQPVYISLVFHCK